MGDRGQRLGDRDQRSKEEEYYEQYHRDRLEENEFEERRVAMLARLLDEIEEDEQALEEMPMPPERLLDNGLRSADDARNKTWICPKCNRVNEPVRLLLIDLPVLTCPCGQKAPPTVEFDFCMSRLAMNNHIPIGNVKNQGFKPHCTAYAAASSAEATFRISSILGGLELDGNGPIFDMGDILKKYEAIRYRDGVNPIKNRKWNFATMTAMPTIFRDLGLKSMRSTGNDPMIYHFPLAATVRRSFEHICHMLASGYPLITCIMPGRNFYNLRPGQIYKCPDSGRALHAIVLIGAGRHEGVDYYHFLNSWGEYFCVAVRNDPTGGYGLLRAEDVLSTPIAFLRHESDRVRYAQHLLRRKPYLFRSALKALPIKVGLEVGNHEIKVGLWWGHLLADILITGPVKPRSSVLSFTAQKVVFGGLSLDMLMIKVASGFIISREMNRKSQQTQRTLLQCCALSTKVYVLNLLLPSLTGWQTSDAFPSNSEPSATNAVDLHDRWLWLCLQPNGCAAQLS